MMVASSSLVHRPSGDQECKGERDQHEDATVRITSFPRLTQDEVVPI
jgi:hypothetical protein